LASLVGIVEWRRACDVSALKTIVPALQSTELSTFWVPILFEPVGGNKARRIIIGCVGDPC
jgi:hypothetical protein